MLAPRMPDSASGVSTTRSGPNSSSRPLGQAEDAAVDRNVLAQHDHVLVPGHFLMQGQIDGLNHVQLSHDRPSFSR